MSIEQAQRDAAGCLFGFIIIIGFVLFVAGMAIWESFHPSLKAATNECRPGLVKVITPQGPKDLCVPGYEVDK